MKNDVSNIQAVREEVKAKLQEKYRGRFDLDASHIAIEWGQASSGQEWCVEFEIRGASRRAGAGDETVSGQVFKHEREGVFLDDDKNRSGGTSVYQRF